MATVPEDITALQASIHPVVTLSTQGSAPVCPAPLGLEGHGNKLRTLGVGIAIAISIESLEDGIAREEANGRRLTTPTPIPIAIPAAIPIGTPERLANHCIPHR